MATWTDAEPGGVPLAMLASVAVHASDAVLIATPSPEGPRLAYVNDSFTRLTGYAPADAVGRPMALLFGPGTDATARARLQAVIDRHEAGAEELLIYREDGVECWVELRLTPAFDGAPAVGGSGAFTHWVAIMRETTQRRRWEEEITQPHYP